MTEQIDKGKIFRDAIIALAAHELQMSRDILEQLLNSDPSLEIAQRIIYPAADVLSRTHADEVLHPDEPLPEVAIFATTVAALARLILQPPLHS